MRNTRRLIAIVLTIPAVIGALIPWLGRYSGTVDAFASFVPVAAVLAVGALLIGFRAADRYTMIAAVLALLLAVAAMAPEWRAPAEGPVAPGAQEISIVTHNVAVANADPFATVTALLESDADILLLQEVHGRFEPFLEALDERYPYRSECRKGCELALFSRLPISRVRYRLRAPDDGRQIGPGLIWTNLTLKDGRSALIATMHLPWPLPAERHAVDRGRLVAALRQVDTRNLVLAGDFNLTPWSAAMAQLDADMAPARRATRALFSFPARVKGKAFPVPFLPIDQMFVGPGWSVVSVERLGRTGSDHYPVKVKLALNPAG